MGTRSETMAEDEVKEFRKIVWRHYRKNGRHALPWRKTKDPYKILVSEVMLQQTQASRVLPFYKTFIKKFPTVKKLAQASLSEVLKSWQGLGYNRRAKLLRMATKELAVHGNISEELPGVGPYTARAVEAFAHNKDVVFVETNIRTAIIHHFFPARFASTSSPRSARAARPILHFGKNVLASRITDIEIERILAKVLPRGRAREWYSALMDYGAHLKRSGISHNARSRHYTKQSKFAGSLREARGAILRKLAYGSASPVVLTRMLGPERRSQMRTALRALFSEQLIEKRGENYTLAR